jgi:hypothetical protein
MHGKHTHNTPKFPPIQHILFFKKHTHNTPKFPPIQLILSFKKNLGFLKMLTCCQQFESIRNIPVPLVGASDSLYIVYPIFAVSGVKLQLVGGNIVEIEMCLGTVEVIIDRNSNRVQILTEINKEKTNFQGGKRT